jgi:hypothetical protein
MPFEDEPDWQWSLQAEPESVPNLYRVQVRVSRPRPDGSRMAECVLTQLVIDPAVRGSTLTPVAAPVESKTGSGSTSSTGSSSSSKGTSGDSSKKGP